MQKAMCKKEGIQMEQEFGKRMCLPEDLQRALAGKKIILAGIENNCRKSFGQQLLQLAEQSEKSFAVSWDLEKAESGDYVILFGCPDEDDWEAQKPEDFRLQGQRAADDLTVMFAVLSKKNPAAAVFVSGNCVYGKCFGEEKARKEQDLGYVCHTAISDDLPARLRFAENLAHRLAKEEGVQIAVARIGTAAGEKTYTEESEAGLGEKVHMGVSVTGGMSMPEALLRILLYGEKGEAYNLPGAELPDESHSPLSPMRIVTDTTKTETLTGK